MEGDAGAVRAITTCCYYKSVVYYSRTLANSCRRSMLFSSGDYPGTLSSILSGEGLDDREQGWSPLEFLPSPCARTRVLIPVVHLRTPLRGTRRENLLSFLPATDSCPRHNTVTST